ncbi:hypothetical protein [Helicobacter cynogastricus]|uniref:hypothetical protein n=1 Tax=Helicobacter cynogastricus TaxID=329937 RepID=UPI001315071C|nr:hypothetical protein [Helicobacter cynogastricus]
MLVLLKRHVLSIALVSAILCGCQEKKNDASVNEYYKKAEDAYIYGNYQKP